MIEGPHGARTRKFLKAHSFPLMHTARYMGTCGQIRFDCPIRFLDSLNVACTNQTFDGARVPTLIAVTLPFLPARCTGGCQTYRYAIPTMMMQSWGPSQNPPYCHYLPSTFERTVPAACTSLAPISFLCDAFLYSSCLRIVASRLRLAISAATRLLLEVQSRTNRFPRTNAPLTFSSSLSSFVCMSSPLQPQPLLFLLLLHLSLAFVTSWGGLGRNFVVARVPLYYFTTVASWSFSRHDHFRDMTSSRRGGAQKHTKK